MTIHRIRLRSIAYRIRNVARDALRAFRRTPPDTRTPPDPMAYAMASVGNGPTLRSGAVALPEPMPPIRTDARGRWLPRR